MEETAAANMSKNIKQTKAKALQKNEIKRVDAKIARQITFSKRKKGLFNKASELCLLCGADVAIVIISPHMRAFTFGHPNADVLIDRFITGEDDDDNKNNNSSSSSSSSPLASSRRNKELDKIKQEYLVSLRRLEEEEKKHDEVVKQRDKNKARGVFWWDQYLIENMEVEELEQYVKSMERVKENLVAKIEELSAASHKASFSNQYFIEQNIECNNNVNGPQDFGYESDDLISCLMYGEGFYHSL